MSFTGENGTGMVMPVGPMYGSGFGNGYGGDFGGIFWLIIIFVIAMISGNGWGFGNGFGGGTVNTVNNDLQKGFDQQATMNAIGDLNSSIVSLAQAQCNGFAQAEIAANSRQMADMNQMFALQSAMQNCCCENRAATADLKYTVATEACADRNAISNALRDVLEANTASTQRILDTLCQNQIDAKNEKIADLQNQLTMANLAASQTAQTARILSDNAAQTLALEQYLNPTPIPAYTVQNPNCCSSNRFGCM